MANSNSKAIAHALEQLQAGKVLARPPYYCQRVYFWDNQRRGHCTFNTVAKLEGMGLVRVSDNISIENHTVYEITNRGRQHAAEVLGESAQ